MNAMRVVGARVGTDSLAVAHQKTALVVMRGNENLGDLIAIEFIELNRIRAVLLGVIANPPEVLPPAPNFAVGEPRARSRMSA